MKLPVFVLVFYACLAHGQVSNLSSSSLSLKDNINSDEPAKVQNKSDQQSVKTKQEEIKRSKLSSKKDGSSNGIDPFFSFAAIGASNVSGGVKKRSSYAGQLYTGIKFDLEKMWGWNGTRAKLSLINRHGTGLSNEVGSVFEPLTLVGGQSTFLYDLSLEKDFGKQISLKAGRTTASDDFSVSTLYYYSLNNTVNGLIRALLLDGLMTTFPFATWGTRLKYTPSSNHRFQLAAYQLGERVFDTSYHGLDFAFRNSDNLSTFFQYDWFGKVADRDARIYVGSHQAFGYFARIDSDQKSDHFMRYYGHFDAELIEGINTFLTLAYSPHGQIAKVPFQSSFGLNWKGFSQQRLEDRILFFATVANFSDEWLSLNEQDLGIETVVELGYRFQLWEHFVIQPSVQYVIQPGGSGLIDNAIIPGVWFEVNY